MLLKILGDVVEVPRCRQQRRVHLAIGVLREAACSFGLVAVIGGVVHAVQTTAAKLDLQKLVG